MRKFKKAIIHIGTEKTGTSSIQQFLHDNQKQLKEEGIYYPRAMSKISGSQWAFVAAVHQQPWTIDAGRAFQLTNRRDSDLFRETFATKLSEEFAALKSPETLLISSEHLFGRLHLRICVARLKELLDPFVESYEVLTYYRRQDRVAVSLLSTRIKSGQSNLGGVLPEPDSAQFKNFNYFKKCMLWASVFGEDAMNARLYDNALQNSHTIVGDFCEAVGIGINGKVIPKHLNPSLTREGMHFLSTLNKVFPKSQDGKIDHERVSLVQDVVDLCKGKHSPINRNQARKFYNQFRGGNEALRKRLFPDLAAPLFEEDFSEYPEKASNEPPDYTEAVEIAVELWKRARYKSSPVGFLERALQFIRRQ